MKNRALDLSGYAFSEGEPLLIDTNVWLYLFPAPSASSDEDAADYSKAFKKMVNTGVCLVMDALVLREYLDVYWRIEWNAKYRKSCPHPKLFRKSNSFAAVGQTARTFADKMLSLCAKHDHPFAACDTDAVLTGFESGAHEINDGLLAETCRHNGWKLVTNDGDFTSGGIEVLTTNPKLLAACK